MRKRLIPIMMAVVAVIIGFVGFFSLTACAATGDPAGGITPSAVTATRAGPTEGTDVNSTQSVSQSSETTANAEQTVSDQQDATYSANSTAGSIQQQTTEPAAEQSQAQVAEQAQTPAVQPTSQSSSTETRNVTTTQVQPAKASLNVKPKAQAKPVVYAKNSVKAAAVTVKRHTAKAPVYSKAASANVVMRNTAANTATNVSKDKDATKFMEKVTVSKDKDGNNPLPEHSEIDGKTPFYVRYDWSVPSAKSGDKYVLELPDQIKAKDYLPNDPIEMRDENNDLIGKVTIDNNVATIEFQPGVDNKQNLKGYFAFGAEFNKEAVNTSGETEIVFPKSGTDATFDYNIKYTDAEWGTSSGQSILYKGRNQVQETNPATGKKEYTDKIKWSISVNNARKLNQVNPVITDKFAEGHYLIPDSVMVNYYNEAGDIVKKVKAPELKVDVISNNTTTGGGEFKVSLDSLMAADAIANNNQAIPAKAVVSFETKIIDFKDYVVGDTMPKLSNNDLKMETKDSVISGNKQSLTAKTSQFSREGGATGDEELIEEPEDPKDPNEKPKEPTEEPKKPEDPKPNEPGTPDIVVPPIEDPKVPSDKPKEPTEEPKVPSEKPKEPTTEESPVEEPKVPSDKPKEPTTEESPVEEPKVPSDKQKTPTEETVEPVEKTKQPTKEADEINAATEEPTKVVKTTTTSSALPVDNGQETVNALAATGTNSENSPMKPAVMLGIDYQQASDNYPESGKLPQTGDSNDALISVVGGILMVITASGMFVILRKRA
ncbi:LPXTG cell wall anchor domain-containing protein [Lentilactobacillus curieae]|uniref:LPXTG cell wall anchor domain-containing protein n=1 Tax=Lentilactobacillus curieae TaxID=1138822 RepID=A0A1S6QGA9_9LACO|nr:Ig-like domain-containing protein [Lentilactobacillus curieae]AQW20638.1 LPXTG cell wall anchor domain-containing protein [Lentilactobacillus curieae]